MPRSFGEACCAGGGAPAGGVVGGGVQVLKSGTCAACLNTTPAFKALVAAIRDSMSSVRSLLVRSGSVAIELIVAWASSTFFVISAFACAMISATRRYQAAALSTCARSWAILSMILLADASPASAALPDQVFGLKTSARCPCHVPMTPSSLFLRLSSSVARLSSSSSLISGHAAPLVIRSLYSPGGLGIAIANHLLPYTQH